MALDPAKGAADIAEAYQLAAAIDADGQPTGAAPSGTFPADFATAYDDYAALGIVLGADNTGGNKSFIETALENGVDTAGLAQAFADYWATVALDPGDPAHGGTAVVSVVNDAATKVALFEAAISASITDVESKPWFSVFVNNIQTMAVSTIVWTVTELMPPAATPTPFPEVIA